MYEAHLNYPECGLIYSQFNYCDIELNFVKTGFCQEVPHNKTNLDLDVISHFCTYKLHFYKQTTGFESYKGGMAEDKDIFFKIEEVSMVKFIDTPLYNYRVHDKGISQKDKSIAKYGYNIVKQKAKERRQKLSIVFPYRYLDKHRENLLNWVTQYYKKILPEAEIIIGKDDNEKQPFSRALAINNGVSQAKNWNILIADIDMVVPKENIIKGIKLLNDENISYIIPYTCLHKITYQSCMDILESKEYEYPVNFDILYDHCHKESHIAGGAQLITKKTFNLVGGYDVRFKDWGAEDYAFCHLVNNIVGTGQALSESAIHLWHPEQIGKLDFIRNKNRNANQQLYEEYLKHNSQDILSIKNMRVHLFYNKNNPHYNMHLKNIWDSLPVKYKGKQHTNSLSAIDKNHYLLVAGELNQFDAYNNLILVNHGAGQSYLSGNHSYAGGDGRHNVKLFIQPNDYAAKLDQQRYPNATQAVIGCSKLDKWHQLKLSGEIKTRGQKPVIAISFHFECNICQETRSAWEYYKSAIPMLAHKNMSQEWEILGHGHPRIIKELEPYYKQNGIEVVHDFEEVMERADLYIMDHMSTLYEFASTNRPVVVLNAPWYRRNVEHGLRYWEYADVGVNCNHPNDLEHCINLALEDPLEQKMKRERACNAVYAHRDGMCTERAVKAIVDFLDCAARPLENTVISDNNTTNIIEESRLRKQKWLNG